MTPRNTPSPHVILPLLVVLRQTVRALLTSHLDTIHERDRQTDGHRMTA